MTPKFTRFLALFSILLALGTAPARAASISFFPMETVGGVSCVNLSRFSLERQVPASFDEATGIFEIRDEKSVLRFRSGGDYLLVNDRLIRMSSDAFFTGSFFAVPESAKPYLDRLKPYAVTAPSPRGAISGATVSYPAPMAVRPATRGVSGAAPTTVVKASTPFHTIRRVVIDAGHGGKDFGAINKYGLREKDIVLDIATKVSERLKAAGIEVVMTRSSDVFIPLADRAKIANKKHADFFVSIHANASLTKSLKGFEVYYLSEATDDAALAVERAENSVLDLEPAKANATSGNLKTIYWDLKETENRKESLKLAGHISEEVGSSLSPAAQRIRTANFYVLKWTECPAALVEIGYLTNREDERQLKNALYREHLADAIVRGILAHKEEFEKTDGFTL